MQPLQLFDPASSTFTYLLFDENTRDALIIDPVDAQLERDLGVLRQYGLKLAWTVETHAHADHITSAGLLAEHAGARTAAPAGCAIGTASQQLQDGDTLRFGGQQLLALHTPGHTEGSMCFVWHGDGSQKPPHLFTGDTLLINGCGRTDFQSGSPERLYHSVTQILFALPDATTVWPGHDYKGQTSSSIGQERACNPRFFNKTLNDFVQLMNDLNLPRPQRMHEAVPANQSSGLRHDAGAVGVVGATTHNVSGHTLDTPRPATAYAGDISPLLAWQWVQTGQAVLVDVRSDAEREWVGFVPEAKPVAWKQWPGMAMNPGFDEGVKAAATSAGVAAKKLVLLCRSGVRSIAAAKRATELGLEAYNILEGFEGDPDATAHRGNKGGWRHRGLPWRQN